MAPSPSPAAASAAATVPSTVSSCSTRRRRHLYLLLASTGERFDILRWWCKKGSCFSVAHYPIQFATTLTDYYYVSAPTSTLPPIPKYHLIWDEELIKHNPDSPRTHTCYYYFTSALGIIPPFGTWWYHLVGQHWPIIIIIIIPCLDDAHRNNNVITATNSITFISCNLIYGHKDYSHCLQTAAITMMSHSIHHHPHSLDIY